MSVDDSQSDVSLREPSMTTEDEVREFWPWDLSSSADGQRQEGPCWTSREKSGPVGSLEQSFHAAVSSC
jgi:hypothetical protein